ncbi:hypothetical protein J6590_038219 [Homalodisca vitripennis]|nr:hypothetical protein J6590_038219 [Homalodisca vitripennis]
MDFGIGEGPQKSSLPPLEEMIDPALGTEETFTLPYSLTMIDSDQFNPWCAIAHACNSCT